MRRLRRLAAVVALLLCAGMSGAGPVGGEDGGYIKLEPGKHVLGTVAFKGGERACVLLMGDHRPVMDLGIYILDKEGKEVTRHTPAGDYCAAIWYPPRDATYIVVVECKGEIWNKCAIAITN